ncbi:hypothetical protein M406DRAFT_71393 [Cryphonectria parasitica EP155]|uniref:Uncharacterized protein n=1 Tax=Cryphonectria parasitica (strain ATCC 38755 / EP155) TaxID=660469 RepID=A0A9P4Y8D6_CRYP1|nr:uncharacterized protein M406DRAFT_71393 [Cryphonectria parasitica EP155]KAF3768340.1 hypothetical protein M406DRAFT_71393 [Cryphonectria parasitica EP155]
MNIATIKIIFAEKAVDQGNTHPAYKDNEIITRLLSMPARDVHVYIGADTDIKDHVKIFLNDECALRGLLIQSRGVTVQKCKNCREEWHERGMLYGCFIVPGKEELGCGACNFFENVGIVEEKNCDGRIGR